MTAHMLSAALHYAGLGIAVFPVSSKKTPLTPEGTPDKPGGFHFATTDREQIEAWWRQWPNAGIGTPDFDVLDVDLYKPQCAPTWERIEPLIPEGTPQSKTTRGGAQFFFQPGTLREGKIGPGVDCRYAWRNYVLLPPSKALGGHYEWVVKLTTRKLKPAPDFGSEGAGERTAVRIAKQIASRETIADDRNTSAFWYAVGLIEASDLPREAIEPRVQAWVDTHCKGDLSEVNVAKQVKGAVKWVGEHGRERDQASSTAPARPEGETLRLVTFDQVRARAITFLPGTLFPIGRAVILYGLEGTGKGLYWVAQAATLSRLDVKTLCFTTEDTWEEDVLPRYVAAGGARELLAGVVIESPEPGEPPRQLDLGFDKDYFSDALARHRPGLVVVDPLIGQIDRSFDADKGQHVRAFLNPLSAAVYQHAASLLGVVHLNRGLSADPMRRVAASKAFRELARITLILADDPDELGGDQRVLALDKKNITGDHPSQLYRVEPVTVEIDGVQCETAVLRHLGISHKTAGELLLPRDFTSEAGKLEAAEEFLRNVLEHGPVEARFGYAQAEAEGISRRTLERARASLAVIATHGQHATWELPPEGYRQPRAGGGEVLGGIDGPIGGAIDGGIDGPIESRMVEPKATDARLSEDRASDIYPPRAREEYVYPVPRNAEERALLEANLAEPPFVSPIPADFDPLEAAARFDAKYPPESRKP